MFFSNNVAASARLASARPIHPSRAETNRRIRRRAIATTVVMRALAFVVPGASALRRAGESSSARRPTRARRATTTPRAFFNFGKKTDASDGGGARGGVVDRTPYLCIDCGYVYTGGDFKKLPGTYRCPTCGVGKNRFKPQGGPSLLAQKKANKEALRAKQAAAEKKGARGSGREALKQKMMEAQREKDQERGRFR